MNLNRRNFLRSSLACGAYGFGLFQPALWQRQLLAGNPDQNKKLIFIFQRGGNDGINTVIPRGDSDYNQQTRPSLFIPEANGLDLGNGFAQLNPAMQPIMEVYNNTALNGADGLGNLAVIHRVGYANQSRSHFNSQDYWEVGVPGDDRLREGMFYRRLAQCYDLADPNNSFLAASISSDQILGLRGTKPFPNFRESADFGFLGSEEENTKFLGKLPSSEGAGDGTGILGLYGDSPLFKERDYHKRMHDTGRALGSSIATVQEAIANGYTPENGAVYPDGSLGDKMREAAMLLKNTQVKVVGINKGGWDTHSDQTDDHADLLGDLAQGFQALSRDLRDQWDDVIIVTMTEFGRTSEENGSGGTDHAEASAMFVAGGGVKGGVYNCDASTWENGAMFGKRDRYLSRNTDFRAVFGEIFTKHFGDSRASLEGTMPGYNFAEEDAPSEFNYLNFLG
jgi:uncharacterized protein (DUF1501 family)